VPVAIVTANRNRQELERVCGLFAGSAVVIVDVDPDSRFRCWLGSVGTRLAEAAARSEPPFETILPELRRQEVAVPAMVVLNAPARVPPLRLGEAVLDSDNHVALARGREFYIVLDQFRESAGTVAAFDDRLYDPAKVGAF